MIIVFSNWMGCLDGRLFPPCCYLGNSELNKAQFQAFQTPSSQIRKYICTSYQQSYGRHAVNAGKDAGRLFLPMKKKESMSASWKKWSRDSMEGSHLMVG